MAVGHGGSVVRTEDAGATWSQVQVEEAGTDSLLDVPHLGGDHFIAYGAFGLYLDSTVPAGRTWTRRTVLARATSTRHISRVIHGRVTLLLVAEAVTLARSDDGGANWTRSTSPYEGSWFDALEADDGSVLVFGMRGNVYRTTDLGATWEKVATRHDRLADGRSRSSPTAASCWSATTGLLALSRDHGRTLELHWSPASKGFARSSKAGGRLLAVGEERRQRDRRRMADQSSPEARMRGD